MRTLAPALLAALVLATVEARAACEYPPEVKMPDGATATQEQMAAAQATVKKYMADMETYMSCLDAEAAAVPADQQTPEQKALVVKRHNAAVDAMENVAAQFNAQVKAFKAAAK